MTKKTDPMAAALRTARGYADGGAPSSDWRSDMDAPKPHYNPVTGEWIIPEDRRPEVMSVAPRNNPTRTGSERALDAVLDYGPIPARMATSMAMQPITAGTALGEALHDPSIPNVTNAGVQAAMTFMQPMRALKALGLGYGAAAAKDFGLLPFSGARAEGEGGALDPEQQKRLVALQKKQEKGALSRAEREEQNNLLGIQRDFAAAAARAKFEAQARRDAADIDAKSSRTSEDLAERNRAIKGAERARDTELARDRRFSDTEMGKLWDKTGGWGPALLGAGFGGASRFVTGGGSALKDYGLPAILGGIAGGASNNIPLAYNAFGTEPDNPEKRAYSAYARELPPDHPRKAEFAAYADKLPDANPVRKASADELYDPVKAMERIAFGAIEGAGGGLGGADMVRMPGRIVDVGARLPGRIIKNYNESLAEARGAIPALESRALPASQDESALQAALSLAKDRRLTDGQKGASGLSEAAPPLRLSPSSELSPSPSSSPNGSSIEDMALPPGVKLNARGLPYNIHTGHPLKKQLYTPREEVEAPRKSTPRAAQKDTKALTDESAPRKSETAEEYMADPGKLTNGMSTGGVIRSTLDMDRRYANGGSVLVGPVVGATGGREDALPVDVPHGSYVIPADCVSHLGSGNSLSGMQKLQEKFGKPDPRSKADGGAVGIKISDGEYVIPPEQVAKLGGGDMAQGHKVLDLMVRKIREDHINTLKALPGPAKG